jgi:protocatechuate 3,4-dioxygenase beta subunit
MRRAAPAALLFLFCLASRGQDSSAPTLKSGAVEGRVVDAISGEPVRKALVVLRKDREDGTGAYTDGNGAFRFEKIEPGAWGVSAVRDGFAMDPKSSRTVVTVKPDITESDVVLKLLRMGAISGRVLDSDGDPVFSATVRVLPLKKGESAASATTNDRGEYRLFHLRPGKYRIAASGGATVDQIRRETAGMGGPVKVPGTPYEAYAITYYPGVTDSKQATIIEVGAGADLQGFDMQLLRYRAVHISGRIMKPANMDPRLIVNVFLMSPTGSINGSHAGPVRDPVGSFEIEGVLPGKYVLTANAGLNSQDELSAREMVETGSSDLEGIQLTLAPAQKIMGRIRLPDGRSIKQGLIVSLKSREFLNQQFRATQVALDGTFSLEVVPPGAYDVVVETTRRGDDLYVSGIRAGDEDVLTHGLHVGTVSLAPIEIVLKDGGATIDSTVRSSNGDPIQGADVRLLPDAPRRDQRALYSECSTGATGTCTMQGIAPGKYQAFAVPRLGTIDIHDPDDMKLIEKYGSPVMISTGEHQGLQLEPLSLDQ